MIPADERLDALDRLGLKVHDRLVVDDELLTLHGLLQLAPQRSRPEDLGVQVGAETRHRLPPTFAAYIAASA